MWGGAVVVKVGGGVVLLSGCLADRGDKEFHVREVSPVSGPCCRIRV